MNRLSLFFFVLLLNCILTLPVCSQVPDKMVYQAVVRNSRGELVVNHAVGLRIWILKNLEPVSAVFIETHLIRTNKNGLATIVIGNGNHFLGSLASIDWAVGPYFLQTDIDVTGGTEYKMNTISQILSVPYSIHAISAERLTETIPETDPVFDTSVAMDITDEDIVYWNHKPDHYSETDPFFKASVTYGITAEDTASWNLKLDMEKQNLASVLAKGNNADGKPVQKILSPSDPNDAVTKAYVDLLEDRLRMLENTVNAGGAVADVDGNLYNIVKIGNQLWMAENLKTTRYNDGQAIPHRIFNHYDSSVVITPAYYWYNNDETYKNPYGALYTYATVAAGKLCPAGWHVPDNAEWDSLAAILGGSDMAGGKMKEAGIIHWESPNIAADNESGFTGIPGGYLVGSNPHVEAFYGGMGSVGEWWSSTAVECAENRMTYDPGSSYYLYFNVASLRHKVEFCHRIQIISVRCIKDETE